MAVRLKLRLARNGVAREVTVLLKSGYEADTPQKESNFHGFSPALKV